MDETPGAAAGISGQTGGIGGTGNAAGSGEQTAGVGGTGGFAGTGGSSGFSGSGGVGGTSGLGGTGGTGGVSGTGGTGGVSGTGGTGGVSGTGGTGGTGGSGPCVPRDCGFYPTGCGTLDDGCGSTIGCACGEGDVCVANNCCTPATSCDDLPNACGQVSDGCGGTIDCGLDACQSAEVCHENACCAPVGCDAFPLPCGTWNDGCGGEVECGPPGCGPVFRVREYYTSSSSGAWNLTLEQPLSPNYFVIIQGSRTNGNDRAHYNAVRVSQDPFGTGDLGTSTNNRTLRLMRESDTGSWEGIVTVVESLRNHQGHGFRLLDVKNIAVSQSNSGLQSNSVTANTAWSDPGRLMLIGGREGPGCSTDTSGGSASGQWSNCHFNLYPSGSNTIHWERYGVTSDRTTAAVMVVQWGTQWTVQRASLSGTAWGTAADSPTHYDTASIAPVARANTWVWGTGFTHHDGPGASALGTILTLGDGVNAHATESSLAIGQQVSTSKFFTAYALTHPDLVVDHRFKPNGHSGTQNLDVDTNNAQACRDRMAVAYNGAASAGGDTTRAVFFKRYTDDTTIRMSRRETGASFAAWVQGIQFCYIMTDAN